MATLFCRCADEREDSTQGKSENFGSRLIFRLPGGHFTSRPSGQATEQGLSLEQNQIVPMNQFCAVYVAEQGLDVLCAVAGDAAGFGA